MSLTCGADLLEAFDLVLADCGVVDGANFDLTERKNAPISKRAGEEKKVGDKLVLHVPSFSILFFFLRSLSSLSRICLFVFSVPAPRALAGTY
jgi:hypothetical protein